MQPELERAKRVARELEDGYSLLDPELCRDVAQLIAGLVEIVENQQCKLSAAVMALNYYRDPSLYYCTHDRPPGTPILDDGLRARTALGIINETAGRSLPYRVPLPQAK